MGINPLFRTDAYNRTMAQLMGANASDPAVFVLQMRACPWGDIIVHGIETMLRDALLQSVTQAHVNEARARFGPTWNAALWQSVVDAGHWPVRVHAVPDGTRVRPRDPIVRITGPLEVCAHIEPLVHRVFYATLVASHAQWLVAQIGPGRIMEFGYRSSLSDDLHTQAVAAALVGGGITQTSSDVAAVQHAQLTAVGTLAHRFISTQPTVSEAFLHAVTSLDRATLVVDLFDPFDGIRAALALQVQFPGKHIALRLDSGDFIEQLRYILTAYAARGWADPVRHGIIVSGIRDDQQLLDIEKTLTEREKQFVHYGLGGLLVSHQKTRADASSAYKLSQLGDRPVMKTSGTPHKRSLPGQPSLFARGGDYVVGQVGEFESGDMLDLAYDAGVFLRQQDLSVARTRVVQSVKREYDSVLSSATQGLMAQFGTE